VDTGILDTRACLTAKGFDDPELLRLVVAAMSAAGCGRDQGTGALAARRAPVAGY